MRNWRGRIVEGLQAALIAVVTAVLVIIGSGKIADIAGSTKSAVESEVGVLQETIESLRGRMVQAAEDRRLLVDQIRDLDDRIEILVEFIRSQGLAPPVVSGENGTGASGESGSEGSGKPPPKGKGKGEGGAEPPPEPEPPPTDGGGGGGGAPQPSPSPNPCPTPIPIVGGCLPL